MQCRCCLLQHAGRTVLRASILLGDSGEGATASHACHADNRSVPGWQRRLLLSIFHQLCPGRLPALSCGCLPNQQLPAVSQQPGPSSSRQPGTLRPAGTPSPAAFLAAPLSLPARPTRNRTTATSDTSRFLLTLPAPPHSVLHEPDSPFCMSLNLHSFVFAASSVATVGHCLALCPAFVPHSIG